jgi:putative endonuclease
MGKISRRDLGLLGEEISAELVIKRGMEILARNFRCRCGEIDIIARDGDQIVFIEVKTRRSLGYGQPEEAVNYHKQAKIRMVAAYYLAKQVHLPRKCRFDVYSLYMNQNNQPETIRVLENCF